MVFKSIALIAGLTVTCGMAGISSGTEVLLITGTKAQRAEKWTDTETKTVCYLASPGGSTSFRMQCLPMKTETKTPVAVSRLSHSKMKIAERWLDEGQGIACFFSSPGGVLSSDLQCSRTE